MMIRCAFCVALFAAFASSSLAQGPAVEPRVVKLTLALPPKSARVVPYPLVPHLRDHKIGNAAIFYERSQSLEWWSESNRKNVRKAIDSLETPFDPMSAKDLEWLKSFGAIRELDYAARCDSCDWQLLDRLRVEGVWFPIPDLASMRSLAAANSVRIRLAVHRGEFDEAAHALQTNFAMAKHVGEVPLLISYLVGLGIANVNHARIEEWVQQPNAPSLYWALAELPQPLVDVCRAIEGESLLLDGAFPEIRAALKEKTPSPIPLEVLRERLKKLSQVDELGDRPFEFSLLLFQIMPEARAHFEKSGLTKEHLDRLPATQIALMYVAAESERTTMEWTKLRNVPYWQAEPMFEALAKSERAMPTGIRNVLRMFQPAYRSVLTNRAVAERNLAMLRTIEAIRLYARDHDGAWPDSLASIGLPIPLNPFTGREFTYRRDGGLAVVEAQGSHPVRYELSLRNLEKR